MLWVQYMSRFFIQLSWLDAQLKEMWEKASEEVKSAYGQDYFDAIFTGTKAAAKEAAKSVSPVIDAMEDAVVNVSPSIRYLVDGSIRLVDYNNVSQGRCYKLGCYFIKNFI